MIKKLWFIPTLAALFLVSSCEKNPIGCITTSSTNISAGNSVTFTSCSSRASGWQLDKATPTSFSWDFGDGTKGTGSPVSHTYVNPGTYNVTLTASDEDNDRSATAHVSITVTRPSDLSRSGKFLAFTSDLAGNNDVYIAQLNPSTGQLATSGLIFSSNPYNLTTSNTNDDKQANWSPDGRILIYSSKNSAGDENIYAFFFNADGTLASTTPVHILPQASTWDENPSFSPDGKYIIFDRRVDMNNDGTIDMADARELYLSSITNNTVSITLNTTTNISNTANIDEGNPKWSPLISVQRIAYERPPTSTSNQHNVYVMDPLNPTNLSNFNNPGSSGYPAWSPNCTSMVFESNSGNGGYYKIVTASYPNNTGTSDIAQESGVNLRYPTWVPNGSLIAYIRFDPSSLKGNIYVKNANGSGTAALLLPNNFSNSNNQYPAW